MSLDKYSNDKMPEPHQSYKIHYLDNNTLKVAMSRQSINILRADNFGFNCVIVALDREKKVGGISAENLSVVLSDSEFKPENYGYSATFMNYKIDSKLTPFEKAKPNLVARMIYRLAASLFDKMASNGARNCEIQMFACMNSFQVPKPRIEYAFEVERVFDTIQGWWNDEVYSRRNDGKTIFISKSASDLQFQGVLTLDLNSLELAKTVVEDYFNVKQTVEHPPLLVEPEKGDENGVGL